MSSTETRHSIIRGNDVVIRGPLPFPPNEFLITINPDAEQVVLFDAPTLEEAEAKARAYCAKNPRQG
jgi:hypothetical protein